MAKGLSLNALAKASKVSRAYITAMERDTANNPSDAKIKAVAKALKVTVSSLVLEEPAEGEFLKGNCAAKYQTRRIGGRLRTVRI